MLQIFVFSTAIGIFSPLVLVYILLLSGAMTFINVYAVKKRVALNDSYVNEERKKNYFNDIFLDKGAVREIRLYGLAEKLLARWREKHQEVELEKCRLEGRPDH